MKSNNIISVVLIIFSLVVVSYQCHYSCKNCTNQAYSGCTVCGDESAPNKVNANSTAGICISNMLQNANIFGICFLILVGSACFIFMSQQIFYFAFLFQTIGLFYVLQTSWIFGIDFILSAFNYLMIFSRIAFAYKTADSFLSQQNMFKSNKILKATDLITNFAIIGLINATLFVIMIIVPVFKAFRKRINNQRVNCLSDIVLDRILLGVRTFFLMNIQQSVWIISFSLAYGKGTPAIYVITIIYFIAFTYFIVNQWIDPFPYFRGKLAQLNIMLYKLITPIFLVLSPSYQYILFIFIVVFLVIDILLTNKNRNKSAVNRLLIWKITGLLAILGFMINYIVDLQLNNQHTSTVLGYLVIVIICFLINIYVLEIYLQWRAIHQLKKIDNTQKSNIQIFTQSKNQTIVSLDCKQKMTENIQLEAIDVNVDQAQSNITQKNTHIEKIAQLNIQMNHKYDQKQKQNVTIQHKYQLNFIINNEKESVNLQTKNGELHPIQQINAQNLIINVQNLTIENFQS